MSMYSEVIFFNCFPNIWMNSFILFVSSLLDIMQLSHITVNSSPNLEFFASTDQASLLHKHLTASSHESAVTHNSTKEFYTNKYCFIFNMMKQNPRTKWQPENNITKMFLSEETSFLPRKWDKLYRDTSTQSQVSLFWRISETKNRKKNKINFEQQKILASKSLNYSLF